MSGTLPLTDSPDSATTHDATYSDKLTTLDELYADCNGAQVPIHSSRCERAALPAQSPNVLITDEVVSAHSSHDTWAALATATPWDLTKRDTLDSIPCTQLDAFLTEYTAFQSGTELFEAAATALLAQPTRTTEGV